MNQYERKLAEFIKENNINAEQLILEKSCHSVQAACEAVNASPEDLVKNICLLDEEENLIVAIVKGEDRVSLSRVGKTLDISPPKPATADDIIKKTGFPCGGVPSFGFKAKFLIDPKVMEKEFVYTGGGSENSLVKINPEEMRRANNASVVRIRK